MNWILGAKERGHRAYCRVDDEKLRAKARLLPEDGVPPEIIHCLPSDNTLDKIQMQKAATPVEGLRHESSVGKAFEVQRPLAVVLERSGNDAMDVNARSVNAMNALMSDLARHQHHPQYKDPNTAILEKQIPEVAQTLVKNCILSLCAAKLDASDLHAFRCVSRSSSCSCAYNADDKPHVRAIKLQLELKSLCDGGDVLLHRYVATTGRSMENQFEPWYFGVAFAFCFKFCVGMPDMPAWSKIPRHRRGDDAPRVELAEWVRLISRRVEQQLRRDWFWDSPWAMCCSGAR